LSLTNILGKDTKKGSLREPFLRDALQCVSLSAQAAPQPI